MDLTRLSAEFPRDTVHWRAQTLTREGDKALALAYLDARDVMDRLDEVCGAGNWQSEITETSRGRVICRLGIRIGDAWVWKTDGAGDTAVEGEKGGISDALKRAAVHWGVGRYLYRMDAVWAPCETYEKNGKRHWRKWRGSPWDHVRRTEASRDPQPEYNHGNARDRIKSALEAARTLDRLAEVWQDAQDDLDRLRKDKPPMFGELEKVKNARKATLTPPDPAMQAPADAPNGHQYQ